MRKGGALKEQKKDEERQKAMMNRAEESAEDGQKMKSSVQGWFLFSSLKPPHPSLLSLRTTNLIWS